MKSSGLDLAIPPAGLSVLGRLVELGPEWVEALQSAIVTLGPNLYGPEERAALLARQMVTAAAGDVERVLKGVILPLAQVNDEGGISRADLLRAVRNAVKSSRAPAKPDPEDPRWEEVLQRLGDLLSCDSVLVEAKARRLLGTGANTAEALQVICDGRPVFDADASAIKAVVLTSTLVVDYTSSDGDARTVAVLLNEEQLTELEAQIARARRKLAQLEGVFTSQGVTRLRLAPPADEPEGGASPVAQDARQ